MSSKCEG